MIVFLLEPYRTHAHFLYPDKPYHANVKCTKLVYFLRTGFFLVKESTYEHVLFSSSSCNKKNPLYFRQDTSRIISANGFNKKIPIFDKHFLILAPS